MLKLKNKQKLFFLTSITIAACNSNNVGSRETVHKAGDPVKIREFLKMDQVQSHEGKVFLNTKGKMPIYQRYDSFSMIPEAFKAYTGIKIGDTTSYSVILGSDLPIGGNTVLPRGATVLVRSKVLDILPDEELMIADRDVIQRKLSGHPR